MKARWFFRRRKTDHYLAMLITANGFTEDRDGTRYTPVIGAAYDLEYILLDRRLAIGLELQAGIGVETKGYAGLGISLAWYR